jgi:predicted RNA-binding protein
MAKTWVLTGSLDNFRATREHGFNVIGAKEGRRRMAEQIAPGDRIVFYVTGLQAFGGIVRVTGEMYEDREKLWPGKPGKADSYPWRFETEPELVLDEDSFVAAEQVAPELEHVRKWPAEHWHLAFQGQLRAVSEADAERLERRIREAAPAPA